MIPRSVRQLTPNFHEIDWRPFQRLSGELLSHEPNISTAGEYGKQGQGQHGIDVLGLVNPSGVEVGQCKCEGAFSMRKIQKASDEFFKHWPYWKDKGVRRFILFVACEVNRTEQQDEILKQRARFAAYQITYELWDAATIRKKLRPYRNIARDYIDSEEIVCAICGPAVESTGLAAGTAIITQRLGIYTAELEDLRGKELEALRELCRAGEQSRALAGIAGLRAGAAWADHTPAFRARVMRFEAALHLNLKRDVDAAEWLVSEARQLDSSDDFQTIDAYLAYCRKNLDRALEFVVDPKTSEARNLRWSLLLEKGQLDLLIAESSEKKFPPDAETHRILALAALARGNVGGAQVEIALALESGAARRNVQLAKAAVEYFSALSPAAEGMKRLGWAVPVSWVFVKRDSASIAALTTAENEFVVHAKHPDCLPAERENLLIWRLACVACVDSRQTEAAGLVKELLTENPANFGAIAWALHRGYEIDEAAAEQAMRARIQRETENPDLWFAIWSLVWRRDDARSGEGVVDEAEGSFTRTGNRDIWLFHKAQFVARKDLAGARKMLEAITSSDLRHSADFTLDQVTSRSGKSRKALAERLAAEFAASGDLRRLFQCCELKLRLGDFAFVAAHGKRLVEGIGTASALRLALDGTFKHGDHALCLTLLQTYRSLFRNGELSPDMRSLKAICQHQLGDWSEASEEAEKTYREQPNLATFSAYFDLLLHSGDTRRCATLARDLLKLKGAKPMHWLRGAGVARLHDTELAKQLWRLANRQPIGNLKLAGLSLELAFSLGLPDEARPLLIRLQKLARQGRGPLREKSMDEIVTLMEQRHESANRAAQLYAEGTVPVHLFAEQLGRPLVLHYHAIPEANRGQTNLVRSPVLFARYGARAVETHQVGSLLIDISSLILAADVGILDQVEASFAPLHLSPHVTESLFEQVTRLTPSQPERQAAREKFLQLVRDGRVTLVQPVIQITIVTPEIGKQLGSEHASLLEYAAKDDGIVLHDGPFFVEGATGAVVNLPPASAARVASRQSLESNLRARPPAKTIANGKVILLPHSVIASLAPDVLDEAAVAYRLTVSVEAVRALESEVASFDYGRRLTAWTQALLDRVQRGITTGLYRIVRISPKSREKMHAESNAATKSLLDALVLTGVPEGLTWCDDRMVNRHLRAGNRVVVGISEILELLRARRALSKEEFYDVLLKLRASNVRYLPLAEGELEHHLTKAEVKDGRLRETPGLATLRRYLNACMLDRGKLQGPLVDPKGNMHLREYDFPMGLRRAVDEVLQATWKSKELELTAKEARADWILDSVYFDLLAMRQSLVGTTTAGEVRDLVAGSIGMHFGEGIGLEYRVSDGQTKSSREGYFDWLSARLLTPMRAIEPALDSLTARAVGNFIVAAQKDSALSDKPAYRKVERALWARFVYDLPAELQNELELPVDVRANLEMTVHGPTCKIGARHYDYREYRQAMAEALNGREGRLLERGEAHELKLRFAERHPDGRVIVEFLSDDPAECGKHTEKLLPVLHERVEDRIKFMESRRFLFDGTATKTAEAIQRIATIESPADRIDALADWEKGSAEAYYRRLSALFSKPGNFHLSDLFPPSWERLLDHLRLGSSGDVESSLSNSAAALLSEEGLSTALRRMMGLPARLPAYLEACWMALTPEAALETYTELAKNSHSLVADLHLVRLAAVRNETPLWTQAEIIVAQLFDPAQSLAGFDCFKAVLKLVDGEFNRWSAGRGWAPWVKLACIWYQASRVHGLLRNAGDNLERLTEWLERNTNLWTEETLSREPVFWSDLGRPNNVTYGTTVLHGLASLVGGLPASAERLGTATKLSALFAHDADDTFTIRVELIRRSDFWGNSLRSFLGQASLADVTEMYGAEAAEKVFTQPGDEIIAARMEDLARAPEDSTYWGMLHSVVGDGLVPAALRPRFIEILKTISFDGLARANPQMLGAALTFVAHQARVFGDAQLTQRMQDIIMGFAPLAVAQADKKQQAMPLWLALPNALLSLAVVPGNEDESARRFFDFLRQFAELCPPMVGRIYTASMDWAKRLPLAQQVNLWPFIFTARALR